MGIPRIIEVAKRNGIVSPLPNVPSMALGSAEVTPLELVTAYAPFANGGLRVKPRLVRSIETADKTQIWSKDEERGTPVMDPRSLWAKRLKLMRAAHRSFCMD